MLPAVVAGPCLHTIRLNLLVWDAHRRRLRRGDHPEKAGLPAHRAPQERLEHREARPQAAGAFIEAGDDGLLIVTAEAERYPSCLDAGASTEPSRAAAPSARLIERIGNELDRLG